MRATPTPRPIRLRLIALTCMIAAAAFQARADKAPPRLEINLRPVRWQPLPDDVRTVYVGPDQRCWYQLERPIYRPPAPGDTPPPPLDPNDVGPIEATIEREF